jgi:hypothetical protein
MANPWDNDPIVTPAASTGNPWDNDPIVKPAAPPKRKLAKDDIPSIPETLAIGAGKTFDSILDGLTQAWLGLKGDDKAAAGLKQNVEEKRRLYEPLQEARPITTAVGETLPTLALPVAGPGASVLTTTGKIAASGAIPAALEYGTVGERATRAAIAGGASVVGGQVLPAVMRSAPTAARAAVSRMTGEVSPEKAALAVRAEQLGIPVSAAQLGNSRMAKTLASTVEHVPLSGAQAIKDQQQKAFNRAVSRTFGEDTDKITRDVYDAARTRLGNEFETLSARNSLNVTPALLSDVNKILDDAAKFGNADTRSAVNAAKNELFQKLDEFSPGAAVSTKASGGAGAVGGKFRTAVQPAATTAAPLPSAIPGAAYQSLDSKLSSLIKGGGEKSVFLASFQDAVRRAMDLSISPADQAAWTAARSQYRNLKTIRDIVAKEGTDGNISPALLMGRINATNSSKEAMARGTRGDLGEIATIGKEFVRETIPNSGTVQRAMAIGILGGGGMMAGMSPQDAAWLMASGATSGRLVNRLVNSPASGKRLMTAPTQSLKDILSKVPSGTAQRAGRVAGMTIGEMTNE